MIRLDQTVGSIRNRDGKGASNFPKDVHVVKEQLAKLGFLDANDLSRREEILTPPEPSRVQTGFFNRERAIEVFDHHDWGTSWLAELIESGGQNYRKNYLATLENRFKALITLNDASQTMGGASPDHLGHQTGLAVDLLLARKDGTVRRHPLSISSADSLFDRKSMKAMLLALNATGQLASVLFDDTEGAEIDEEYRALFINEPVCKRHAQVQVKKPAPIEGEIPAQLNEAVTDANRPFLVARFLELGYFWAGDAEVKVSRHRFDRAGNPARNGRRYDLKQVPYIGLEWAIRLFKSIIGERAIVDQRSNDSAKTLSPEEMKWLFAKNAPKWLRLPLGTIEANRRFVDAIKIFQALTKGELTTRGSSGFINPHEESEEWLDATNAPNWVALEESVKLEIVEVPHDQQRRFHSKVAGWTKELIDKACDIYEATRVGTDWPSLAILHPGARYLGASGSETGLRVRVPTAAYKTEAMVAIVNSFQQAQTEFAGAGALRVLYKEAITPNVEESSLALHVDMIEIQVPGRPLIGSTIPTSTKQATFVTQATAVPTTVPGKQIVEPQKPRLGFITEPDAPNVVTGIALRVQRSVPQAARDRWEHQPLLFELPLAISQEVDFENLTADSQGLRFVTAPSSDSATREKIDSRQAGIEFPADKDTEWQLDTSKFKLKPLFAKTDFEPFAIVNAKIVFEKGFKWTADLEEPTKSCYLSCEFGRGLLAKPLVLKLAIAGPENGAIPNSFTIAYLTAPDSERRAEPGTFSEEADESESNEFDYASGTESASVFESETEEQDAGGNLALFEGWRFRFPLGEPYPLDLPLFGADVKIKGSFDLLMGNFGELAFNFHGDIESNLDIALGSSMVRLRTVVDAVTPLIECDLGTLGFNLRFRKIPGLELCLDPFERIQLDAIGSRSAALANAFEDGEATKPLIALRLDTPELAESDLLSINWNLNGPRISRPLLIGMFRQLMDLNAAPIATTNKGRALASLAGKLLGDNQGSRIQFDASTEKCRLEIKPDSDPAKEDWLLSVPLKVILLKAKENSPENIVLAGDGLFRFSAKAKKSAAFIEFEDGSFSCATDNILTVINENGFHSNFGLISLHIPRDSKFQFRLDPKGPRLKWDPTPTSSGEPALISLRVPALDVENDTALKNKDASEDNSSFAFDLDRFDLHPGGLDLHAGVRTNRVNIGLSKDVVFAEPLQVMPVEKGSGPPAKNGPPRIGEVEFRNGRLVGGSLRATGRLPYFDNATGTLGLVISEDQSGSLNCLGTFDVKGAEKFDLAALYAQCEIRALHLETKYSAENKWSSNGQISGMMKFVAPKGRSASDMGPLAELFQGVTVDFEDVDLLKLANGSGNITLTCPPKSFRFAEIMRVDLRGLILNIGNKGDADNVVSTPGAFQLLGDITLERLPGVNSSLSFGGITLNPSSTPDFSVSRVGGQITVAGGFTMDGMFEHIKNAREVGFVGSFGLQMSSFPRVNGLIKLTRIQAKNGSWVPSLALFLESDFDVTLFAGFFLRRIGAGIGLRQGLRGLVPDESGVTLPMPQRILKLVDDPRGLPEPRSIDSWTPIEPATERSPLDWMFVATGLITFGKLPNNKPHTFAGTLLLAIDQNLEIVLAVNAWLFTSPDETLKPEFLTRPVVRGAIALSIRDRRIFAYFKTLRDPKLGEQTPEMLKQVLKNGETSLLLTADRNGFLLEIGWPWQTKYNFEMGPLKGELLAGFRFGIYRGVLIFGLNFGIELRLDASQELSAGPATASISVSGQGYFRTSFEGAITREFKTYLRGNVVLGATVHLSASLVWEIRIKVFRRKFSKKFRKSASLSISLHAALKAAMEGNELGFAGTADIALSICGFSVNGRIGFSYNESLLGRVDQALDDLMPPSLAGTPTDFTPMAVKDRCWNYRYCRLPSNPDRLRVVFFPCAGLDYPAIGDLIPTAKQRFQIKIKQLETTRYKGIVGIGGAEESKPSLSPEGVLQWTEDFQAEIVSINEVKEMLARLSEDEKKDVDPTTLKRTLADILRFEPNPQRKTLALVETNIQEDRDERTRRNGTTRAEDETDSIGEEGVRSPNFTANTDYDRKVNDASKASSQERQLRVYKGTSLASFTLAVVPTDAFATDALNASNVQLSPDLKTKLLKVPPTLVVDAKSRVWWWKDLNVFAVRLDANSLTVSIEDGFTANVATEILNGWSDRCNGERIAVTDKHIEILKDVFKIKGIDVPGEIEVSRLERPDDSRLAWIIEVFNVDVPELHHVAIDDENRVVAEIETQRDEHSLDPGSLFAELLEFMRDPLLKPGERPRPAQYDFAPHLRLVLEFDVKGLKDIDNSRIDPVPKLLDLSECSFPDNLPLEPVAPLVNDLLPEYDLIIEDVFQATNRICISWDFVLEESSKVSRVDSDADRRNQPFEAFRELEHYVVSRIHRSGDSLEPKIVTLQPSWLDDRKGTFIRPQFQFVDDDVYAINDGDLVDYLIEAKSPDRLLASTEFTVIRRTVKPLPAVPQSLAIQEIVRNGERYQQSFSLLVAVGEPALEVSEMLETEDERIQRQVAERVKLEEALKDQLRVRYRLIACFTIGSYGFDEPPPNESGTPSPENVTDGIQFPESLGLRPLPWTETRSTEDGPFNVHNVTWERVETNGKMIVLRSTVTLAADRWPMGRAVEFHVGREIPRTDGGTPLQRSPLTRCRHSVVLHPIQSSELLAEGGDINGKIGNVVAAFELFPDAPIPTPRLRDRLCYEIDYGGDIPPSEFQPRIDLEWLHDVSGRGGFDRPKDAFGFNPVVGYTLDHFDQLAPEHYDRHGKLRVSKLESRTFFTMPETLYRSIPSTILVHGMKTEFTQPAAATTIDQVVADRLQPNFGDFANLPGNWKPKLEKTQLPKVLQHTPPLPDPTPDPLPLPYTEVLVGKDIEWPGGPVWLDARLHSSIVGMLKALGTGSHCRLVLNRPLVDRIADFKLIDDDPNANEAELKARFQKLRDSLDLTHDPYGWYAAEALGRSCECLFYDAQFKSIRAERVRDVADAQMNLAIFTFAAQDGITPLNVVRLILPHRPTAEKDLAGAVILQTMGREPAGIWDNKTVAFVKLLSQCQKIIHTEGSSWLDEIYNRLVRASGNADEGKYFSPIELHEDPRYGSEERVGTSRPAAPWLPIDRLGRVRCEFGTGDQWAHRYRFSLTPIRRYDLLRRSVDSLNDRLMKQETLPEETVVGIQDLKDWTKIPVDRTKALAPPKIIASPLPGGVQFITLRHPAEFAANASADNQAHTQFGGQTVHWMQRRVPDGVEAALNSLRQGPTQEQPIDWTQYTEAMKPFGEHAADKAADLSHPLIHQSFPGTDVGIYGADRHINPDVPAYYEYRTYCSVAAGRSQRASGYTAWVRPIVESHGTTKRGILNTKDTLTEPQVPRVQPVKAVEFADNLLTVQLELAILQHLLTPEFRTHWSASDEVLTVRKGEIGEGNVRLGLLPDLTMTYQLFFRSDLIVNPDEILNPDIPPMRQELMPMGRVAFALKEDEGVFVAGETPPPGITKIVPYAVQLLDGRLVLKIDISVNPGDPLGKRYLDLIEGLRTLAPNKKDVLRSLIIVQGQRDGSLSKITEPFEAPHT